MDNLKDEISQRYKKLEQAIDKKYRNEKEKDHPGKLSDIPMDYI